MNIALLHYSIPPVVGGVESVIEHHAHLMTDAGHRVSVIAGRGKQFDKRIPFIQMPLADSRAEAILSLKRELDKGVVPEQFDILTQKIQSELLEHLSEMDILIAHNVCSLNKNLPLTAALFNISRQTKKPRLVLWHHDLAWATPRYRKELHEGYPWDLLRTAWENVEQVTISDLRQSELVELMKIDESRISVVPNGVDIEKFFKLEKQTRRYIDELDLLKASPLLLLPVRITPRKNIELAIKTLALLREKLPAAELLITGPLGPHNPSNIQYFEDLQKLRTELGLSSAVHFLAELAKGYIPDPVIADFYRLADALIFPSFEEGFGIPILEAGFSNLPIFCSDIAPLRRLGGESANYFPPDEKPEITSEMIYEHFSDSMVFGLRSDVRAKYTWERVYATKIAPILNR